VHTQTVNAEREAGLIDKARALRPLLLQNAASTEEAARVGTENIQAIDDAGLWAMATPRRWGGLGSTASALTVVCRELATACPATAWNYYILHSGTWMASLTPDRVQEQIFADGPTRICGSSNVPGLAVAKDGGYRVDGQWHYCSGCHNAQWGMFFVTVKDADGGESPGSVVFVRMDEVEIRETWKVAGLKGTGSHTCVLTDHFVPHDMLVRPEEWHGFHAPGKQHVGEDSDFWPVLTYVRCALLSTLVGIAEAVLDRVSTGTWKRGIVHTTYLRQADSSVMQREIGETTTRIQTARLIVDRITDVIDRTAAERGHFDYIERARARSEVSFGMELLTSAVDRLMFIAGSSAFAEANDLQRYWRDLAVGARHAFLIPSAGYEIYGRALLGVEPNIHPPDWL
jgi:alkylation response protein AidB-like acyl-CoA dehydrogenase